MHSSFKPAGTCCRVDAQQVALLATALSLLASTSNLGRASCCRNIKFGPAWTKGHSWKLSASAIFSFLPQEAGVCCQPGCEEPLGWGPALVLWCPKSSCQHPSWVPTVGWGQRGYKDMQQQKIHRSVFLMPPLQPHYIHHPLLQDWCVNYTVLTSSAPIFHWVKVNVYNKKKTNQK